MSKNFKGLKENLKQKNLKQKQKENIVYYNDEEKDTSRRCRAWCFTSFEKDKPVFNSEFMTFLCFSPEICPTTKKEHWQGFIYFIDKVSLQWIKKNINGKWWLKNINGTIEENIIYCGKEQYEKNGKIKPKNDKYEEYGKKPREGQGNRTDLKNLTDKLLSGEMDLIKDVIINDPMIYHQYGRTLDKIDTIALNNNKRKLKENELKVIWMFGGSGLGKSARTMEFIEDKEHYLLNVNDNGFWEGYRKQKIVILNDFRGEIPFANFLAICDIHFYNVKQKSKGTIPLMADTFIITSSKHPVDIYNKSCDKTENIGQLLRRCLIIDIEKNKNFDLNDTINNWKYNINKSNIEPRLKEYYEYKEKNIDEF